MKMSDNTTGELKPCPFCGSNVELVSYPIRGYNGCVEYSISCGKCGCRLNYNKGDTIYRTDKEAKEYVITKWNTRSGEKLNV